MGVKSPLRWAGSKRKMLPILRGLWQPTDGKYIEVFAGSASLFFEIEPARAVLNDSNVDLMAAYRVLATQPLLLHHLLMDMPVSSSLYYEIRNSRPNSNSLEGAIRFFYLNRYCFNGIYRTNREGIFNVPFSPTGTGGFPSLESWRKAASLLSKTMLLSGDFESVVHEHVAESDFVYLDPPYLVSDRRVFAEYSGRQFSFADVLRLRDVMAHIDRMGATFVLSYESSPEIEVLAKGWSVARCLIRRNVAGFGQHRRHVVEVLVTNRPDRLTPLLTDGLLYTE